MLICEGRTFYNILIESTVQFEKKLQQHRSTANSSKNSAKWKFPCNYPNRQTFTGERNLKPRGYSILEENVEFRFSSGTLAVRWKLIVCSDNRYKVSSLKRLEEEEFYDSNSTKTSMQFRALARENRSRLSWLIQRRARAICPLKASRSARARVQERGQGTLKIPFATGPGCLARAVASWAGKLWEHVRRRHRRDLRASRVSPFARLSDYPTIRFFHPCGKKSSAATVTRYKQKKKGSNKKKKRKTREKGRTKWKDEQTGDGE